MDRLLTESSVIAAGRSEGKTLVEIFERLDIQFSPEEVSSWFRKIPDAEDFAYNDMVVAVDKLRLFRLMDDLIKRGPMLDVAWSIESHNLKKNDVVLAWARGYPVKFDGVIDFTPDPRIFLLALEWDMPVETLVAFPGLTDEHMRLCTKLKTLIAPNSPITFCPQSVEKLDISGNCGISDVMHCANLKWLNAKGNIWIHRCPPSVEELIASKTMRLLEGCVNLKKLDATEAERLFVCPDYVEDLNISGNSGMRDLSKCLCLRRLNAAGNHHITTLSATTLESVEELDISGDCSIWDLTRCRKLRILNATWNRAVSFIPSTVQVLSIGGTRCGVSDISHCLDLRKLTTCFIDGKLEVGWALAGVVELTASGITEPSDLTTCRALRVLKANDNPRVIICPDMVEELDASGTCGISDVSRCRNLRILHAGNNSRILRCPDTVTHLYATGTCGITCVMYCPRLKMLDATNNRGITKYPPTVEELYIRGRCGITDLINRETLKKFSVDGNPAFCRPCLGN